MINDDKFSNEEEIPTLTGDECDIANSVQEQFLNLALKNHQQQNKVNDLPEDFDGCCVLCGEPIPLKRIELLKTTICVDCQRIIEQKRK